MFFGGHEEHTLVMAPKAAEQPVTAAPLNQQPAPVAPQVVLNEEICGAFAKAVDGVTFESNSANLTTSAKNVLRSLGISLTANPEVSIEIQAHTDSDGSADYNQTLSEQRAQSAMNYLIELGVEAVRLSASGFGENQPIADNTTREGKARNRRVEFIPLNATCN